MSAGKEFSFLEGIERLDLVTYDVHSAGIEINNGMRRFVARSDVSYLQRGIALRVVAFGIKTEFMGDGNRGEFFEINRANMLAGRAIEHFAQYGDVEAILFNWFHPDRTKSARSTNYDAYMEALAEIAKKRSPNTVAARQLAAQQTWTYAMIAEQYGFNVPGKVINHYEIMPMIGGEYPEQEPYRIEGLFLKPGVI